MSQRFISSLALALAGAVGVVSSQVFSAGVTGWVIFGISLGTLALLPVIQPRERTSVQDVSVTMGLDAATALLALWSAVASVVYTGATLTWLSFAESAGFVLLGVAGLVVHEVWTEHVLRAPVATDGERAQELQAAA
jgi:hypothetical protein